jgi:hypothetical protein
MGSSWGEPPRSSQATTVVLLPRSMARVPSMLFF